MTAAMCELCPRPAAWLWSPGIVAPVRLCDDHAAGKDLDDLEEL